MFRRALASVVSLSLILASAPTDAWSQVKYGVAPVNGATFIEAVPQLPLTAPEGAMFIETPSFETASIGFEAVSREVPKSLESLGRARSQGAVESSHSGATAVFRSLTRARPSSRPLHSAPLILAVAAGGAAVLAVSAVAVAEVRARREIRSLADAGSDADKLASIERMSEKPRPEYVDALMKATHDKSPPVRLAAENALRAVTAPLEGGLRFSLVANPMAGRRRAAARRLGALARATPKSGALHALREAVWRDHDPDVRLEAIEALAATGTVGAMESLHWFRGRLGRPVLERAVDAALERLRQELGPRAVPANLFAPLTPSGQSGEQSRQHLKALMRVVGIGVAAATVTLIGSAVTGSLAIRTDAFHTLADTAVYAGVALALWFARRAPTAKKTFGFGKTESLVGLLAGVVLMYTAWEIGLEAFARFAAPPAVSGIAPFLLGFVGLTSNIAMTLTLRKYQGEGMGLRAAFLHAIADAFASGAVIISGALAYFAGWSLADPIASVIVTGFIAKTSLDLLSPAWNDLLNGVPAGVNMEALEADLRALPGVKDMHALRVWGQGSQRWILTTHLMVPAGTATEPLLQAAKKMLRDKHAISDSTIQIEILPTSNVVDGAKENQASTYGGPAAPPEFDVVVVGSGFGGSVAALRFAEAGYKVAVLEQGKRHRMGEFPKGEDSHWKPEAGRFGIHWIRPIGKKVIAWGASGVGGGSLNYASVMLRKDDFTGFPAGIDRKELDPYYDVVESMLGAAPYPLNVPGSAYAASRKSRFMLEAGAKLGAKTVVPKLAVTYQQPGEPTGAVHLNPHGAPQQGCRRCGECSIPGCNYGAKNTLDLNYLKRAEGLHGATIVPSRRASRIEKVEGGAWRVHTEDPATGDKTTTTAKIVVLAAGSLGTTKLLLENRDVHKTLPALSQKLGSNYTTNGNFIGFAVGTKEPAEPAGGPEITAGIELAGPDGKPQGLHVFDGGYRQPWMVIGKLVGLPMFMVKIVDWMLKKLQKIGMLRTERTLPLLVLGRDPAMGRLVLGKDGALEAQIDLKSNSPYYKRVDKTLRAIVKAMGARFLPFLVYTLFKKVEVPHSLGGAPMADDADHGVVDPQGRVYGYDNLLVLDGSMIPASLGVNPALTIAALSERAMLKNLDQLKTEGKLAAVSSNGR